jgi:hypothetical protein
MFFHKHFLLHEDFLPPCYSSRRLARRHETDLKKLHPNSPGSTMFFSGKNRVETGHVYGKPPPSRLRFRAARAAENSFQSPAFALDKTASGKMPKY